MAQRTGAQVAKPAGSVSRPRLLADVGRRAALALISLPDEHIVSVSDGAVLLLGLPERAILGRRAPDFVKRPLPQSALELLRGGYVDFYRAHLLTRPARGSGVPIIAWVHGVELDGRSYALAELAEEGTEPTGFRRNAGQELVLGSVDRDWRITAMADNALEALGVHANQLVGRTLRLLDRPRLQVVRSAIEHDLQTKDAISVCIPVTAPAVLAKQGVHAGVLMGAADPHPAERFVVLARSTEDAHEDDQPARRRVGQLEHHLWRIAAEVEASGILYRLNSVPTLRRLPEAAKLSPRQFDVLRRLLQGKRVTTIAQELFISQSTVRNHLSAIFERFGVNSQAELLARLTENGALSN